MKENIIIPIKIERLKLWTRWTLEAASWLICLGLLAASGAVASLAALVWLISGSEVFLTLGLSSGLVLGPLQVQGAVSRRIVPEPDPNQLTRVDLARDHADRDGIQIRIGGELVVR